MEVAEQNCGLRAGDEQDNENQEQKSEHVIHLMRPERDHTNHGKEPNLNMHCRPIWTDSIPVVLPNAVEDEEKLDKDAAKGQNSTHYNARNRFCKERLLWNLTGDLVCPHWLLNRLFKRRIGEFLIS